MYIPHSLICMITCSLTFFIKIYFQIVEHWLITKLLVLYKSPQPITGEVAFKAGFRLSAEVCQII